MDNVPLTVNLQFAGWKPFTQKKKEHRIILTLLFLLYISGAQKCIDIILKCVYILGAPSVCVCACVYVYI